MSLGGLLSKRIHANAALLTLCGILFLTFLDTTIMSVALADLQATLHTSMSDIQWIVNAYALMFASLMLAFGTLGDRFGRKRVMLFGVVVFIAGSLFGALAPNTPSLIAARAIMGIGAAACEPGTLSIIRQLFPDSMPAPARWACGRPSPGWLWPWDRSSAASWSDSADGRPSSGSIWPRAWWP